MSHARCGFTSLSGTGETRGIEFEGHGRVGFVDGRIDCVWTGETVAKHNERVAGTVIDRYGSLMAIFSASL